MIEGALISWVTHPHVNSLEKKIHKTDGEEIQSAKNK